jgi:peptide subunit release factor 1 (eRF1)
MITQEQFQALLSFEPTENKVLSLYLSTDGGKEPIEAIKLKAKNLLREVSDLEPDVQAIETYLNHSFDWKSPGLALFSSQGGEFFEAFPTAVSFRNRIRVTAKPYLKPLGHLLDHYAHYGVILVDRVGARFFAYHLGELQTSDGFMGEEIHKLKQGSGSSAIGRRGGTGGASREEENARRNLRETASAAVDFFSKKPIRRLFLGGTTENTAQFRDLLPKQMQSCLAGSFVIDMNAGEHEVRAATLQLLQAANAEREKKLIKTLLGTAASGGPAVLGLDDTLQAISDRRVQTLVLSDGFRLPGYIDLASGFVVANLAKSPMSHTELTAVDDVIDNAFTLSLSQGAHIEVIRDDPDLDSAGKIGAILRF